MPSIPSLSSSRRLAVASLLATIACGPKGGTEAPDSGNGVTLPPEAKADAET